MDDIHEDQYTISDFINISARSSASYWYDRKWKEVNKCVFCDLKKRFVIKELDDMILTTNIYPYIDGHLMIIPKNHVTALKELTSKQWDAVRTLEYASKKMLRALYDIKSVWILYREGPLGGDSQKTVEHLHIQILPYTDGLVKWNFQEISAPPFETASKFKENMDVFDDLVKRYKLKYSK